MADQFEWPWQYNFPPFYTLQPNLDTRNKQLDAWCDLILSYYKNKKAYMLDVTEAMSSELFYNKKINRKLSKEALDTILEELNKKGNLEWEDKTKQRCHVMWRKPEEWAALIFKWIEDNSMTDTVCTLYELMSGDDTVNQEFHGIDMWMMKKALSVLESKGKAQMFEAPDATDESGLGVKFYN
ncbi:vacuolar protein-sorting-associated protein 25-like [Actinia tenebrosa]|uniref:Vacuolar protein-sorting-associated protein 25 n=1 Tax=Actinia tenebrosa TaxID=6105 RepID=A0A6P8HZS5_ACTTE|nr:vacuolar protein-sorting-associated protein 25-like [Actinia tenebrosa]